MGYFKVGLAITCVAMMGLSGCRKTQEVLQIGAAAERNPGPCPRAFSLYDASRMVEFRGSESYENVGFTAEIEEVRSFCRYYSTVPIEADLEMDMAFGRGPAATQDTATYEYFVTVTRKNIDVIAKEIYPITVTFPPGVDRVNVTETIEKIIIPRANENTSGANFEIVVGMNVTDKQRRFNAEGKRFRVSAGQN